jgi:putative DNA primase/helicase
VARIRPETGIWAPDKVNEVHRRVVLEADKGLLLTEEMAEEEAKFASKPFKKLKQVVGNKAALEALSWHAEYKTEGSDWDADENLLGCANGILDLRTGKLVEIDPANRVSKSTHIHYHEEWDLATAAQNAPRFAKFLTEVTSGDDELADFYLRWFGYSLFGHARAQKFLIMSGKLGRNGKGVLKRLMLKVFGEYAAEVSPSLYTASKWGDVASDRPRADLMMLFGLRLTFVPEPSGTFNTEMLKQHTGGDRITAGRTAG